MFKLNRKITIVFVLVVSICFGFGNPAGGGERPTRREEKKTEGGKPTISKPDKWTRGQRIESFKNARDGKVTERREPSPRGGKPVAKVEKWSRGRGQLTERFNKVANPQVPPSNPGGGKTGGGAVPPAAPAPKPKAP